MKEYIIPKMKKEFSTAWKASKQPRKQRKYVANAPLHIKKKFVSVNLSKELRKKYGKRNIGLRKGDLIKIKRGKFKGRQGKILEIKLKLKKITVDGINVKKMDGSKVNVKLQHSNLQIIELNLDDKKRLEKLKKEIVEVSNPKTQDKLNKPKEK